MSSLVRLIRRFQQMATKSFSAYTARPTHCVFRQVAANTGCESIVGVSFSIFE